MYQEFIDNILQTRGRFACGDEYHERHHIIPKCLGGTNDENNLIDLFAREHFEAHRLLALENLNERDLCLAWWCMSSMKNENEEDRYICTPEEFEEARKAHSNNLKGENNPMYGVHRYGELNPMYGKKHSEETKKKIAEKSKMNVKDWTNNPYIGKSRKGKDSPAFGVKRSEETKKKLSEIRKVHKKIVQYDKDGNFIKSFNSEWEASEELGISVQLIRYSLKRLGNTAKNNIFILIENEEVPEKIIIPKRKRKNSRKIGQYTLEGEFVAFYDSLKEASTLNSVDSSSIIRCCNGKNRRAGNFIWKYEE